MDKYEYNLKLEEIDKLVERENYGEAAKLADTIDWRRVRNIRTLCLISEIYEAAGRLDDSKQMLVKAYRKVPVGRTVLYRLAEVTTALKQYDEALEYYTEYVQAAPHDNNRFILKYKIYRGRGSSTEELIEILKEYLDQEYTERWAYELATLYRQAGQTQNCLAVCDDLVLWFHTGKYVKKALELKRHYAALTPRQRQIYEECLEEEARQEYLDEPEEGNPLADAAGAGPDGEVIAETIMSETEKEIADEITARKAELDKEAGTLDGSGAPEEKEKAEPEALQEEKPQHTRVLPRLLFGRKDKKNTADNAKRPVKEEERPDEEQAKEKEAESSEKEAAHEPAAEPRKPQNCPADALDLQTAPEAAAQDPKELQEELARSVRQIVSGVARKPELNEDDVPAVIGERLNHVQKLSVPEIQEPQVGKLSIDDILLSMGEKGKRIAEEARKAREAKEAEEAEEAKKAEAAGAEGEMAAKAGASDDTDEAAGFDGADDRSKAAAENLEAEREILPGETAEDGRTGTITEAAVKDLTEEQLEALKYTSNPGSFLRKRSSLPAYSSDALGKTRKIVNTREELLKAARRELLATETIKIPVEEVAKSRVQYSMDTEGFTEISRSLGKGPAAGEAFAKEPEALKSEAVRGDFAGEATAGNAFAEEGFAEKAYTADGGSAEEEPAKDGFAEEGFAEKAYAADRGSAEKEPAKDGFAEEGFAEKARAAAGSLAGNDYGTDDHFSQEPDGISGAEADLPDDPAEAEPDFSEARLPDEEAYPDEAVYPEEGSNPDWGSDPEEENFPEEDDGAYGEEDEDADDEESLAIPDHLRGLFGGFTEVEGLEEQIANAILQAEAKGADRTSRTGNVLIFGAHSSGKTTLATGIAKAVAQDKGSQVVKLARIYAADLNRRDIAATIAKISGGTLIIEEAGDLKDEIVDQLTTAMEFRTDGLLVILEDEQSYVHDLLMRHPRFTMKFTAQIYLPAYTAEELGVFGQKFARSQDYVISEEGLALIGKRISEAAAEGRETSIGDVIAQVEKAIRRSNRFLRKLTLGKKRYDENDFIILYAKDFK